MKFKGFMKRHKNRIMCIVSAFVLFCGCVFSSSLKANAQVSQTGYEFYLNYARPMVSDNAGYINVLFSDYSVVTYFWNINCNTSDGSVSPASAYIDLTSNSLTFGPLVDLDDYETVSYNFYSINKYGIQYMLKTSESSNVKRTFSNTIIGWKAYGDVVVSSTISTNTIFTVYYADDGSSLLLMEVIDLLMWTYEVDVDIYNTAHSILNSVDGLENQLTAVTDYLKSVDEQLSEIKDELQGIYDKLDEILEEEKKQTSWLEKIWNSIQEFINPDEEQKEQSDAIKDKTNEQSNELKDLTEQSKTEQVDIGQASATVDSAIDGNAMANYGVMLQIFTNNDYIFKCLLLTITISLVAFVIFGKR